MAEARKKTLIVNILEILRRYSDCDHRLSQAEIKEILKKDYGMEVDRKAIKRNLTDLIDCGYSIEYSEKERTSRSGEKEYIFTDWYLSREFTDAELRLIIDSLLFSKHIPQRHCKELIGKVSGLSSKYFAGRVKHVRSMPTELPQSPELFYTIEILDEAIDRQKQVIFEYCDYGTDKKLHPRCHRDGSARKYTVNPYQMAATGGRYYLIGNLDPYDNIAHYRVDRISGIVLTDTPSKPMQKVKGLENGLDLPEHMAENIYMFGGECGTVTLRLKKQLIGDVIDWFGMGVRFFDESEDEVTAAVRVSYDSMKFWALQYGEYARILSPEFLANTVADQARRIAEQYADG